MSHIADIQFFCHFRLTPENQILNDLYQDLNQNESSILLNQAPIIATESNLTGEILGEFNLPVSTEIVNENSQNLQSLVFDSLDGVQGLDHQAAFDQYGQNVSLLTKFDQKVGQEDHCWSGTSLFLDGQPQEDEVTLAHIDPTLVTGQVILELIVICIYLCSYFFALFYYKI